MTALIIQALGSTGLFASRAFVPAFAAALCLRFGDQVPLLGPIMDGLGLLKGGVVPGWFTSDITLVVLGVLAALEIAANKNPDARALLNSFDKYLKPGMAALTFLGVSGVKESSGFIEQTFGLGTELTGSAAGGGVLVLAAGVSLAGIFSAGLAAVSAIGTFVIAAVRSAVLGVFFNADPDDDAGIQKLFSWAGDLWASFGVIFLILFPFVMIALIAIVTGGIAALRWWLARKEEKSRVACGTCNTLMYRCAMACGSCRSPNPNVCDVGVLGQSDTDDPADMASQPRQLAEARRCPLCATRLPERDVHQSCTACDTQPFADPAFVERYQSDIAKRLPLVLGVGALLSAIPVIGLIPGVIYYRMALVAPFRRYLPWGKSFVAKWAIRLVMFLLIAVQWIPAVGIITVPAMALISFLAYRGLFRREIGEAQPAAPAVATA